MCFLPPPLSRSLSLSRRMRRRFYSQDDFSQTAQHHRVLRKLSRKSTKLAKDMHLARYETFRVAGSGKMKNVPFADDTIGTAGGRRGKGGGKGTARIRIGVARVKMRTCARCNPLDRSVSIASLPKTSYLPRRRSIILHRYPRCECSTRVPRSLKLASTTSSNVLAADGNVSHFSFHTTLTDLATKSIPLIVTWPACSRVTTRRADVVDR